MAKNFFFINIIILKQIELIKYVYLDIIRTAL